MFGRHGLNVDVVKRLRILSILSRYYMALRFVTMMWWLIAGFDKTDPHLHRLVWGVDGTGEEPDKNRFVLPHTGLADHPIPEPKQPLEGDDEILPTSCFGPTTQIRDHPGQCGRRDGRRGDGKNHRLRYRPASYCFEQHQRRPLAIRH